MPSIVTHNLFAKDVFKRLPKDIETKLDPSFFELFAQSFDNFFYYHFLTPWKGKEIRKFGGTAQTQKVNLYFENIIDYMHESQEENDKDLLSFLYGSICHYVLDSTCHPYIIYYSGEFHQSKKYYGMHEKMEINLDAYMYEKKTKQKLKDARLGNELLPTKKFPQPLRKMIDEVYEKTFHLENMGTILEKSIKTGNFLVRFGVTDKTGIKKFIYKIKDFFSKKPRKYQYLSFHVTKIEKEYLNEDHNIWYNPTNNKIKSTKSFEELYEDAINKGVQIITEINRYFQKKLTKEEVLQIIGNNSYKTGLSCEEKRSFKYFKF